MPDPSQSEPPSPAAAVAHSVVPDELSGQRFDQIAARLFPDYSRARLQQWIKSGELTADGSPRQPKDKLFAGVRLQLDAAPPAAEDGWVAQPIALRIVFEDDDLLVLNKPAGLVVHPAAGHADGTLLNALLHHCPALAGVPRAGIVHRLDKDTSGLMVVAKHLRAQAALVAQLQARTVRREYAAVACGVPVSGGTVAEPIGRHPRDRQRMAVLAHGGKEAITHYRVLQRFRAHSYLQCRLETGRTHQIRVHMAHIRLPLVGDPVYGGRLKLPAGASSALAAALREFPRQALHARRLELIHPGSGLPLCWTAPLPADMAALLALLAVDAGVGLKEGDA